MIQANKNFYFLLFFILSLLLYSGCNLFKQDNYYEQDINTQIVKGKIIPVQFVNKAGKPVPDVSDLYLEFNNEKYFIKLSDGNYLKKDLQKYINKNLKFKINSIT